MMHTGDVYEARARAARHRELKALTRAFSRFVFRSKAGQVPHAPDRLSDLGCANDRRPAKPRAA